MNEIFFLLWGVASMNSAVPLSDAPASTGLVRTDGRAGDQVGFEESVTGFFVDAADLLGVPKSLAAIYGICFASAEPLSFSDIQERLALSAGSISQGLKVLREVGALKVVQTEADRREFFVPDLELRKLVDRWIAERLQRQLSTGRQRLQAMGKGVPAGRAASTKVLRDRIKHLQNWHDKASAVLPLVRGFLKLGKAKPPSLVENLSSRFSLPLPEATGRSSDARAPFFFIPLKLNSSHESSHSRRWSWHSNQRRDPPQTQADGGDRGTSHPLARAQGLLRARNQ